MGPHLRDQAVTKQIVAAFSFALNTNLNTTPRQLLSGCFGIHHVHALVFKFCVQSMAEENNNMGEPYLFGQLLYIGLGLSGHI